MNLLYHIITKVTKSAKLLPLQLESKLIEIFGRIEAIYITDKIRA